MIQYPSKYIEKAVEEISKLPGIGKKTALRLTLHLLKEKEESSHQLANSLVDLRTKQNTVNNVIIFLMRIFAIFAIVIDETRPSFVLLRILGMFWQLKILDNTQVYTIFLMVLFHRWTV